MANGINVQPGHTLVLNIDVEQRELAHLIVKEAYAWGTWSDCPMADDYTTREKFLHAPMDRLDNVPDYKIAEMNYLLEHKASRLGVRSSDPGVLNGVDAEKLSASLRPWALLWNQCASPLSLTRSAGQLLQQQV